VVQGLQLCAPAELNAKVETEAINAQFKSPAAHRFEDQLGADRIVGSD
jgi:hypothetical protein